MNQLISQEWQYLKLLSRLLPAKDGTIEDGTVFVPDRTGTGTYRRLGEQLRFDLSLGFPLLTTKKVSFHIVKHELIWMLSGDTNIKYLNDNKVHIWDEWAAADGNLGPVYGEQWRSWSGYYGGYWDIDQLRQVWELFRKDPYSRRLLVSAWNPLVLDIMQLPPCHYAFQLHATPDNGLSISVTMRSADVFLGVPYNIAFYALLLSLFAKCVGREPRELILTMADCHLYANHVKQAREQLKPKRTDAMYPMPWLIIDPRVEWLAPWEAVASDFRIANYNHHAPIEAPVAV